MYIQTSNLVLNPM